MGVLGNWHVAHADADGVEVKREKPVSYEFGGELAIPREVSQLRLQEFDLLTIVRSATAS